MIKQDREGTSKKDKTVLDAINDTYNSKAKNENVTGRIISGTLDASKVATAVQHPSHYTSGKYETIDVIEDITNGYKDGFVAHCVGTATKYVYRAPFKHDSVLEDIKKAIKYLEFAVDHLEKNESNNK